MHAVIWLASAPTRTMCCNSPTWPTRVVKTGPQNRLGCGGCASVRQRRFSICLTLTAAAHRLTVQDVRRAAPQQPGGPPDIIRSGQREFNVTAATDLQRAGEFRQMTIKTVNGQPSACWTWPAFARRWDERTSVPPERSRCRSLGVIRPGHGQPAGAVGRRARERLDKVRADLPPGITVDVG